MFEVALQDFWTPRAIFELPGGHLKQWPISRSSRTLPRGSELAWYTYGGEQENPGFKAGVRDISIYIYIYSFICYILCIYTYIILCVYIYIYVFFDLFTIVCIITCRHIWPFCDTTQPRIRDQIWLDNLHIRTCGWDYLQVYIYIYRYIYRENDIDSHTIETFVVHHVRKQVEVPSNAEDARQRMLLWGNHQWIDGDWKVIECRTPKTDNHNLTIGTLSDIVILCQGISWLYLNNPLCLRSHRRTQSQPMPRNCYMGTVAGFHMIMKYKYRYTNTLSTTTSYAPGPTHCRYTCRTTQS